MKQLQPALLGLLIVGLIGCGEKPPPLVPVTGKVVMQNKPVTAGNIFLHPDAGNDYQKDKPSSQLQLDGSFTFKTFPFGEGVPPGKYKVTLSPELAGRLKKPTYGDPSKTPWSLEVPSTGLKEYILEVK